MKKSKLFTYLSYLFEIPVEKRESSYSGLLELTLHKGEWKLSSKNAIYSFGNHYSSFRTAFKRLQVEKLPFKNVLMFGVGIGSVADLLKNHPTIKNVTAVDIDEMMIEWAKELWPETNFKTRFVVQDALEWLQENPESEKFDLILADIFIDDVTPEKFTTHRFLDLVKQKMSDRSLFIFSKINYTDEHKKANQSFEKNLVKTFSSAFSFSAQYNKIYVYQQHNTI
ncbi:MAG: fused MFS/spermidine synthase [Chitinophagales bacterium]|nr:fused MFS/spermidine synthase [Chitinophagales bacterium]